MAESAGRVDNKSDLANAGRADDDGGASRTERGMAAAFVQALPPDVSSALANQDTLGAVTVCDKDAVLKLYRAGVLGKRVGPKLGPQICGCVQ